MTLGNKVIIVTGAANGIGKELALSLIAKGAKVIAVDLNSASLSALKKEASGKDDSLVTFSVDISDKKAVYSLAEKVKDEVGDIDGIINNAGIIQDFVKVRDLTDEMVDRVMNVNFYGTLNMVRAFLPYLSKRPEAHIVNVSSMGGFLPVPGQAVYGASKAAVKLLTEGLYAELKNTNVHVSVVFPGATKTNIAKNSGVTTPNQKDTDKNSQKIPMLSAKKAAQEIIRGIEKNKVQIFSGKDSRFMNLLYRLRPVFATNFIAKKMGSLLDDS